MDRMALPRSHAGVRLRAKAQPTQPAIFSASDSRGAPARICKVADLFAPRLNDEFRMTNDEGMTKSERRANSTQWFRHLAFGLNSTFVIPDPSTCNQPPLKP